MRVKYNSNVCLLIRFATSVCNDKVTDRISCPWKNNSMFSVVSEIYKFRCINSHCISVTALLTKFHIRIKHFEIIRRDCWMLQRWSILIFVRALLWWLKLFFHLLQGAQLVALNKNLVRCCWHVLNLIWLSEPVYCVVGIVTIFFVLIKLASLFVFL